MQTLSMYLIRIEEADEELVYYDDFSLLLMQVIKQMGLKEVNILSLTDISGKEFIKETINDIIDCWAGKDIKDKYIITATVDISTNEFPDDVVCTEEIVENIQEAILRDCKMLEDLGFEKVENDYFEIPNTYPYIYKSELGEEVLKAIASIKPAEEKENE